MNYAEDSSDPLKEVSENRRIIHNALYDFAANMDNAQEDRERAYNLFNLIKAEGF